MSTVTTFLIFAIGTGLLFTGFVLYKKKKEEELVTVPLDEFPGPYSGKTINEPDSSLDISNENRHVSEARNRALNTIRRRIAEIADLPTDSFKVMDDLDALSRVKLHGSCGAETIFDVVQIMMFDPTIGDPLRGIQSVAAYESMALKGAKGYLLYYGLGARSHVDLTDIC